MTEMKTIQFGEDGEIFEVTDEKARNKAKHLIKVTDGEIPEDTDLVVGEEETEIEVVTTADISELRDDLTRVVDNFTPMIEEANRTAQEAEIIAKGRATGYVFDTTADMEAWLADASNVAKLVMGDNLYIRETDVPDYWWDGASAQKLETQKVDLTEYIQRTAENRASSTQLGIIKVSTSNGVTTYADGTLVASARTAEQVESNSGTMLMGLGTMRNLTVDFECVGKDGTTTHYYLPSIPPKA